MLTRYKSSIIDDLECDMFAIAFDYEVARIETDEAVKSVLRGRS